MTRNPNLALSTSTALPFVKTAVDAADPLLVAALLQTLGQAREVLTVELADAEVVVVDLGTAEQTRSRASRVRAFTQPVVAVVADAASAAEAMAAGAKGVVLRAAVSPSLGAALLAVRAGLTVVDGALAGTVIPSRPRTDKRGGDLTERERQVVQLMADGLSNKLIADRLGISDHTAKFHVNGVMAKLTATTRTEAVVEAVRRGLVSL